MAKRPSNTNARRGDGQFFAWALSALLMVIISPAIFQVATSIYNANLEDHLWRYDYAELLVYPVFALCMVTGFYAFALVLRFVPKFGLLAVIRKFVS